MKTSLMISHVMSEWTTRTYTTWIYKSTQKQPFLLQVKGLGFKAKTMWRLYNFLIEVDSKNEKIEESNHITSLEIMMRVVMSKLATRLCTTWDSILIQKQPPFCKEGKGGHLTNLRISFAAIGGFGDDFGFNAPTPQLLFSTVQTLSQIRHGCCSSQTPKRLRLWRTH